MTLALLAYAIISFVVTVLIVCACVVSKRAEADAERARGQ